MGTVEVSWIIIDFVYVSTNQAQLVLVFAVSNNLGRQQAKSFIRALLVQLSCSRCNPRDKMVQFDTRAPFHEWIELTHNVLP